MKGPRPHFNSKAGEECPDSSLASGGYSQLENTHV